MATNDAPILSRRADGKAARRLDDGKARRATQRYQPCCCGTPCGCGGTPPKRLRVTLKGFDLPPLTVSCQGAFGYYDCSSYQVGPCVQNIDGDYVVRSGPDDGLYGSTSACVYVGKLAPCAYAGFNAATPGTGRQYHANFYVVITVSLRRYVANSPVFGGNGQPHNEDGYIFDVAVGPAEYTSNDLPGSSPSRGCGPGGTFFGGNGFIPDTIGANGGCYTTEVTVANELVDGCDAYRPAPMVIAGATVKVRGIPDDDEVDTSDQDFDTVGPCTQNCDDDPGSGTGTGTGTGGGGTGTGGGTGSGTGSGGTGTGTGTGSGTSPGTGTGIGTGSGGGTGGGTSPGTGSGSGGGGTGTGTGTGGGGGGTGTGTGTGTGSGTGPTYDCPTCGQCCVSTTSRLQVRLTPQNADDWTDAEGYGQRALDAINQTYDAVVDSFGQVTGYRGPPSAPFTVNRYGYGYDETHRLVGVADRCGNLGFDDGSQVALDERLIDGEWYADDGITVATDGTDPGACGGTAGVIQNDCNGLDAVASFGGFGCAHYVTSVINNNCCNVPGTGCVKQPTSNPTGFCA